MPAGGSASKVGLRYEEWWTVSKMLEIIEGRATSIRIEDPAFEKSEFTLKVGARTELHQAKISNPNGQWSLAVLGGKKLDLLTAILGYLGDPQKAFHFVSGSDAPELRSLTQLAREFHIFEEFEEQLGKGLTAAFEKIRAADKNLSHEEVHDRLQRVFVVTTDERILRRHVRSQIGNIFLGNADAIEGELFRLAKDRLFETLSAQELLGHLAAKGFLPREVVGTEEAGSVIRRKTEDYVSDIRRKLIGRTLIERSLPQDVWDKIRSANQSRTFAITGAAGAGKSAVMLQLIERLVSESVPTLAFRLDRIPAERSSRPLGQRLGLGESPVHLLAAVSGGDAAVLVIDQLDAVSTVSGRDSVLLDAVAALLEEVEGMRLRTTIHVILACRGFDWDNDHRLRRLLSEGDQRFELGDLSDVEVDLVLAQTTVARKALTTGQAKLLRNPQNLSLFYDARESWKDSPDFISVKDLFDAYWDHKRMTVGERTRPVQDCWPGILRKLVDRMSESQQLSVPREALDSFPTEYVGQMVSEGVLVQDGGRIAFGHESFFDYCFARGFVDSGASLLDEIERGAQKLFLRAQVRQVLGYLRDADPPRYLRELEILVFSSEVRSHLKDLILSLVFRQPDVWEGERELLLPVIERFVTRCPDERNRVRFKDLVWQHFSSSSSWFADETVRESIRHWLGSKDDDVIDLAIRLLCRHQREDGDTVAGLIKPYLNACDGWENRMRWIMSWADFEKSRRFFEIFLVLVDQGSFDEMSRNESQGHGIWVMIHGLGANQPVWLAELVSHWLRRHLATVEPDLAHGRGSEIFHGSQAAGREFSDAALRDPVSFVRHVLPAALEVAEVYSHADAESPRRDSVWWNFFENEAISAEGALRHALIDSLKVVRAIDPAVIDAIRSDLKSRTTYFANTLLLEIYEACGSGFADEAVDLFCEQPWRFHCGYSDSSYWIAILTLKSIGPHCSMEHFERLENAILGYAPNYEKSSDGYRASGRATHSLLSALPPERLSPVGRRRWGELVRKFGEPDLQPRGVRSGFIGSPISEKAIARMTDAQWIRAVAKYQGEERDWNAFTGGASELAAKLGGWVKKEPERFSRLLFLFPKETNSCYFEAIVSGLAEITGEEELKLEVARYVFEFFPEACGKGLARLLSGIETPLQKDFLEMMVWIATEHPDPEKELWETDASGGTPFYGGSIHMHGYNTARGTAMESIARLIWKDHRYLEAFSPVLRSAVKDESKAVRSCAASVLRAVAYHNPSEALKIFQDLIGLDPELLVTNPCRDLVYRGIPEHFDQVRPYIECLLRGDMDEARKAGGGFAFLAVLWEHAAEDLVDEAIGGPSATRLGVCEVASRNLGQSPCREQCEEKLRVFFDDEDEEVCRQAANCFREIEDQPLADYGDLITLFCESSAYGQNSHSLLHALEKSNYRIADHALTTCRKFLDRFAAEARDISTRRAAESRTVSTLLFRAYQQGDEETSIQALDLIDNLVMSGAFDVQRKFEEFER